ncbi:uncharacterized protein Z519_07724 [Cladophialophora bantiana CBS 173.52]|uniref:BTB domain-containing protein n=1 Tax=Cladophialophora bantiana (strain ATCC 10958 / CBS 173.52 / CDC B-1940 / NIH 8579) TaxID=1442370 RepID=A0A0D2EP44_CLAB1|nr:uncharacterized protein Z519_07724 [Cladophialophora bantiana CBS 173.52]KIW91756.1 hypothetical protein Z519_07724 [Cladophialophora bantiana CBS 173.52]
MAGVTPSAYLDLLRSEKYSDFTIACNGVEFKVHRAVVCPASPFLDSACNSGFQEATSRRIEFREDDPGIVARVVLFLYTSDYDANQIPTFNKHSHGGVFPAQRDRSASSCAESAVSSENLAAAEKRKQEEVVEALKINALVYKCADMLGIENLKVLAADRFLADAIGLVGDDQLAEPLRVMYESTHATDEHLRLPVTTLCIRNHDTLSKAAVQVIQEHEHNVWSVTVHLLQEAQDRHLEEARRRKSEWHIIYDTVTKVNDVLASRCASCHRDVSRILVRPDNSMKGQCRNFCRSTRDVDFDADPVAI